MPRLIARTLAALALALAATATACRDAAVLEHWQPSTPHERYAERLRAAALDSTALGRDWLAAADSVLRIPVPAALPFREVGYFAADEARAVAYRVQLRAGQRVVAEISGDGAALSPGTRYRSTKSLNGAAPSPEISATTRCPARSCIRYATARASSAAK